MILYLYTHIFKASRSGSCLEMSEIAWTCLSVPDPARGFLTLLPQISAWYGRIPKTQEPRHRLLVCLCVCMCSSLLLSNWCQWTTDPQGLSHCLWVSFVYPFWGCDWAVSPKYKVPIVKMPGKVILLWVSFVAASSATPSWGWSDSSRRPHGTSQEKGTKQERMEDIRANRCTRSSMPCTSEQSQKIGTYLSKVSWTQTTTHGPSSGILGIWDTLGQQRARICFIHILSSDVLNWFLTRGSPSQKADIRAKQYVQEWTSCQTACAGVNFVPNSMCRSDLANADSCLEYGCANGWRFLMLKSQDVIWCDTLWHFSKHAWPKKDSSHVAMIDCYFLRLRSAPCQPSCLDAGLLHRSQPITCRLTDQPTWPMAQLQGPCTALRCSELNRIALFWASFLAFQGPPVTLFGLFGSQDTEALEVLSVKGGGSHSLSAAHG